MSVNRLGHAKGLDRFWSESLLNQSETRVDITSEEADNVHAVPDIEDYPYEGQRKLTGDFTYVIDGIGGDTFEREGKYEYRLASGVFLVNTVADEPKAEEVFSEINKRLDKDAGIEKAISLDRDAIWNFIEGAEQKTSITFTGRYGRFEYRVLKNVLKEMEREGVSDPEMLDDPHEIADIDKVHAVYPVIEAMDDITPIESLSDFPLDRSECIIEEAKVAFRGADQLVTVNYSRGKLDIEPEDDRGREYVLQLFEKEVIHPTYGE